MSVLHIIDAKKGNNLVFAFKLHRNSYIKMFTSKMPFPAQGFITNLAEQ